MPKLKTLSGGDVVKIFYLFGFEIEAQRGSHVKLRRFLPGGTRQTLTIPMHDEMDKGTLGKQGKQGTNRFGGFLVRKPPAVQ